MSNYIVLLSVDKGNVFIAFSYELLFKI